MLLKNFASFDINVEYVAQKLQEMDHYEGMKINISEKHFQSLSCLKTSPKKISRFFVDNQLPFILIAILALYLKTVGAGSISPDPPFTRYLRQ